MAIICKGCLDRFPACQDHCQKPEIIKEREDKKKRYEGRMRDLEAYEMQLRRTRRRERKK